MDLIVPHEKYLEAGVHIGTRIATTDMKKFVYKYRKDKLVMLSIDQIDKRIKEIAEMLSKYDPAKIAVVASRVYAIPAVTKFAEVIGARAFTGRFVPGTFTNPSRENFFEPDVVVISDPRLERQALSEATELGILTVGLVDTDNTLRYMDYFIPCNNKGKKSVPFVYFLLAREFMKKKNLIASNEEFPAKQFEFELGGLERVQAEAEAAKKVAEAKESKPTEEKPAEIESTEKKEESPADEKVTKTKRKSSKKTEAGSKTAEEKLETIVKESKEEAKPEPTSE